MTSWRILSHMFAIVLLCMIDLSKLQECKLEYFRMKELKKTIFSDRSLPDLIQIARIDSLKDMVECTVERQYLGNKTTKLKSLLQCILKENISNSYTKMDKCQVGFSQYVTHYHFMCLMIKAADIPEKRLNETDCRYDVALPVYETKPTTESPTTSTAAMQPTTTRPERTAAPTDLQPSLPTPLQTTSTTTTKTITTQTTTGSPNSSASSDGTHDKVLSAEIISMRTLFTLSLFFHMVWLIVFLYMHHQKRQYRRCLTIIENGSHQIPPGVQPGTEMMSSTQLPSASQEEVESSHLIQPP